MEEKVQLIATASFGVEAVVARELKHLGYEEIVTGDGKVTFTAPVSAICRANLWLRCAERVFLKMGEFEAKTFDQLFEGAKAVPWENWLPADAAFPVTGSCVRSTLMSISDCQSIIKKAIVERLKKKYGFERFPETGAKYRVVFWILKDIVILGMDTSGEGLHKRGYRRRTTAAPLKETLASAMLLISRWTPDKALLDPFCGSGTIPIEAAMIGLNLAPGLNRSFDAQYWGNVSPALWEQAVEEACDLAVRDKQLQIAGYDIDEDAIDACRFHAREAEVDHAVHFQVRPMREASSRFHYGVVVTNPPYGERMGEKARNAALYREMADTFQKNLETWSFYVITSDLAFEQYFGRMADKKRKLYNGGILCYLYQYYGPKPR